MAQACCSPILSGMLAPNTVSAGSALTPSSEGAHPPNQTWSPLKWENLLIAKQSQLMNDTNYILSMNFGALFNKIYQSLYSNCNG